MTLLLVAALIFLAYVVYGLIGFGASIVGIPLLAQVIPLKLAVPLMLIMDLVSGFFMGMRNKQDVDRKELRVLLAWMAVGMVIGVTLLVNAPESILLVLLGVFALSQAGKNLLLKPNLKPIGAFWGGIYCTVGGIFTSLYGTGGPIYVVYLSRRIHEEVKRRATMATLIFLSGFGRLALFLIAGIMLQADLLIFALAALPMSLLGTYAGSRLRRRLSLARMNQVVWLVVGLAGLLLLARNIPKLESLF